MSYHDFLGRKGRGGHTASMLDQCHLCKILYRIGLVLLTCLCTASIGFVLSESIIMYHFTGDARLPADCAIVFGAAVYGRDVPGQSIIRRVSQAVDLYFQKKIHTLYFSGGRGKGLRVSEAQVMQRLAIKQGVKSQDIVLEDHSRSTWENLLLTRPMMSSCHSVIGISDRTHLARIKLLAGRQGWNDLRTLPASLHPSPRQEMRSVLREALGYVYYALHIDQLWGIGPSAAYSSES